MLQAVSHRHTLCPTRTRAGLFPHLSETPLEKMDRLCRMTVAVSAPGPAPATHGSKRCRLGQRVVKLIHVVCHVICSSSVRDMVRLNNTVHMVAVALEHAAERVDRLHPGAVGREDKAHPPCHALHGQTAELGCLVRDVDDQFSAGLVAISDAVGSRSPCSCQRNCVLWQYALAASRSHASWSRRHPGCQKSTNALDHAIVSKLCLLNADWAPFLPGVSRWVKTRHNNFTWSASSGRALCHSAATATSTSAVESTPLAIPPSSVLPSSLKASARRKQFEPCAATQIENALAGVRADDTHKAFSVMWVPGVVISTRTCCVHVLRSRYAIWDNGAMLSRCAGDGLRQ